MGLVRQLAFSAALWRLSEELVCALCLKIEADDYYGREIFSHSQSRGYYGRDGFCR